MYRAAVITASDSGHEGRREDRSGPLVRELAEKAGYHVVRSDLLPDDREKLAALMAAICDEDQADLILTTGGTGFSLRDCMPEATEDVVERKVPGIPEAMRWHSLQITPRAMLSRATAGIRGRTLIVNLPGSPKAAAECLEAVLPTLEHGLAILRGEAENCGR